MFKKSLVFVATLTILAVTAFAPALNRRTIFMEARTATGTNRFLSRPLSDLGAPFGTAGFSNVGAFNESGGPPLPLTTETPASTLLATFVDPGFLALFGKTPGDVDQGLLNLPLRSVAANVSLAADQRAATTPIREAEQLQPSQAMPAVPITLGDWVRARGIGFIRCEEEGSRVRLELKGLLPNRLYSVWALFGGDAITPFPLGGVPNLIVTDRQGNASFERELNFCPFNLAPGQRPLLAIDVVFHSDSQNYGIVPEPDLAGLFTGTVTHTQLEFLVTGTPLR